MLKKLCDDCAIKALIHSYSLKEVVDIVYRPEIGGAHFLPGKRAENYCAITCVYACEERLTVFYKDNIAFLLIL